MRTVLSQRDKHHLQESEMRSEPLNDASWTCASRRCALGGVFAQVPLTMAGEFVTLRPQITNSR